MATFSIGSALQQERLRQGVSLEEIAEHTRISLRFLQAIEADQLERLPGTVFARNFVRQFARALQMDPEGLLAELPTVNIDAAALPEVTQFAPSYTKSRWATAVSSLVWVGLAAGTSAGAWLYFNQNHTAPKGNGDRQASGVVAKENAPTGSRASETAPSPVAAVNPAPEAMATAGSSAELPGGLPAGVESHPVQVLLRAHEASWVQVIADGRNAFTGILNPNDSRTVDADELVKVTAGNAGGLEISLNGKPLEPLGPSGQVRTVRLTAEGPQMAMKTSSPL